MIDNHPYLSRFADLESMSNHNGNGRLSALKREAANRFQALGFPSARNEDWKYTSLKSLMNIAFEESEPTAMPGADLAALALHAVGDLDGIRLVLVDGRFDESLSRLGEIPRTVTVKDLRSALATDGDRLLRYLGCSARLDSDAFAALNTAFLHDGAFIHIPRGVTLDLPVHLIYLSTASAAPTDAHPRTLIVVEENARVVVVEDHIGPDQGVYFSNPVTEAVLAENADLVHHKLHREGSEAFHIGGLYVRQHRDSRFASHVISGGGRLVRNTVTAVLAGENCRCTLNGLTLGSGERHIDNHTSIDHATPHCSSQELYKAILDERSEGVFTGRIHVARDAQETNALQSNHALLLTDDARMNTRPQLEIHADDVKCTHGATVGHLDKDALFYLKSRGLAQADAENLLINAFAREMVDRIEVEAVRNEVEKVLYAHRPQG